MEITYALSDIQHVAAQLIKQFTHRVIVFDAPMATGKTTLIKALCEEMGVTDTISSPTFSLVNEYQTKSGETLYHFDFYRLKNQTEALDFGVEDYLYSGNFCFLEWADKIPDILPEHYSTIKISALDSGERKIEII